VAKRTDRTKVVILTQEYRIEGEIALVAGARLTDWIIDANQFLAVTNAEVTDHVGREILSAPFLNVNKDRIEMLVPM